MIYKIGQIRYNKQQPPILGNNIFQKNANIIQLGIQAPPGTRFLINNIDSNIVTDIEIGITGIFELDLKDANTAITWLSFTSIKEPDSSTENWDILIDYLYQS